MILLIGMLFIKEEETRGTFVSTLYTTSSQSGKRRNQPFSLLLGEGVSNVQFNRKGQHLLAWIPPGTRRENKREREKVNTHKTSFTKNPTNPNMINPVKERE